MVFWSLALDPYYTCPTLVEAPNCLTRHHAQCLRSGEYFQALVHLWICHVLRTPLRDKLWISRALQQEVLGSPSSRLSRCMSCLMCRARDSSSSLASSLPFPQDAITSSLRRPVSLEQSLAVVKEAAPISWCQDPCCGSHLLSLSRRVHSLPSLSSSQHNRVQPQIQGTDDRKQVWCRMGNRSYTEMEKIFSLDGVGGSVGAQEEGALQWSSVLPP